MFCLTKALDLKLKQMGSWPINRITAKIISLLANCAWQMPLGPWPMKCPTRSMAHHYCIVEEWRLKINPKLAKWPSNQCGRKYATSRLTQPNQRTTFHISKCRLEPVKKLNWGPKGRSKECSPTQKAHGVIFSLGKPRCKSAMKCQTMQI